MVVCNCGLAALLETRLFLARCHLAMGGGGSVSLYFCVYMCSICPSCAALPAPLLSALCVSLLTSFRPAFSALFIFVRAPVSPLPLSPCCSPAFFPPSSPCGASPLGTVENHAVVSLHGACLLLFLTGNGSGVFASLPAAGLHPLCG